MSSLLLVFSLFDSICLEFLCGLLYGVAVSCRSVTSSKYGISCSVSASFSLVKRLELPLSISSMVFLINLASSSMLGCLIIFLRVLFSGFDCNVLN